MKNILQRIKCLFGFHKYEITKWEEKENSVHYTVECVYCNKKYRQFY